MVHNIILCYFIFDYFVGPVHVACVLDIPEKKSLRMQIFSILLYPCIRLKYEDIVINNSEMSL